MRNGVKVLQIAFSTMCLVGGSGWPGRELRRGYSWGDSGWCGSGGSEGVVRLNVICKGGTFARMVGDAKRIL